MDDLPTTEDHFPVKHTTVEVPDEFDLQRLQQEVVLLIRNSEDPVDWYLQSNFV